MGRNNSKKSSNDSINSAAKWKSCSSDSLESCSPSSKTNKFYWDEHDKEAFKIVRKKNRLEAQNVTGFILDDTNEIADKAGINYKKYASIHNNQNLPNKKTIDRMLKNVGQKMRSGAYDGKKSVLAKKPPKIRKRLVT